MTGDGSLANYLPLVGGTLTGALTGVGATFNGQLVVNHNFAGSAAGVFNNSVSNGSGIVVSAGDGTGNFLLDLRQSNGVSKFKVSQDGSLTGTSATFSGDIDLGIGLTLSTTATQSNIVSNANNLNLKTTGNSKKVVIAAYNTNGSERTFFVADGATEGVSLFHASNLKLETTSSGVTVSGSLTGTSAAFSGDITISTSGHSYLNIDAENSGASEAGILFKIGGTTKWETYTAANDGNYNIYSQGQGIKLAIKPDGNVGIGTDDPKLKLNIIGTNSLPATSGVIQNGGIRIENGVNSGVLDIGASNASGAPGWLQSTDKGDLSAGYNLLLNPNGGNIGIGTSSPANKFVVAEGTNQNGVEIVPGSISYIQAYDRATMDYGDLRIHGETLSFGTDNGTERMRIDASGDTTFSGKLLLGTGASAASTINAYSRTVSANLPSAIRIIENTGASTYWDIGSNNGANPNLNFYVNSNTTPKVTFASSGNVGIGTDSPDKALTIKANEVLGFKYDAANGSFHTITGGGINPMSFTVNPFSANTSVYSFNGNGGNILTMLNGGNVGIGTDSPGSKFEIQSDSAAVFPGNQGTINGLIIRNNNTTANNYSAITFIGKDSDSDETFGYIACVMTDHSGSQDGDIAFGTSYNNVIAERMRIDSAGNVLIGKTVSGQVLTKGIDLREEGGVFSCTDNSNASSYFTNIATSGTRQLIRFYAGTTQVGSINSTGSSTAYNTTSDYRLKEDLKDFNGLEMVSNISVYDYKWKIDESRSYGVMAHELQEVLPQAVSGEKDAEEMQGVDYSKIVPLLVKAIQELTAKVAILEQK